MEFNCDDSFPIHMDESEIIQFEITDFIRSFTLKSTVCGTFQYYRLSKLSVNEWIQFSNRIAWFSIHSYTTNYGNRRYTVLGTFYTVWNIFNILTNPNLRFCSENKTPPTDTIRWKRIANIISQNSESDYPCIYFILFWSDNTAVENFAFYAKFRNAPLSAPVLLFQTLDAHLFYFGRTTPPSRILRFTRNSETHRCPYRFTFSDFGRPFILFWSDNTAVENFCVSREIPKRTVVRIDFTFFDLGRPFYFGRATPLSRILRYTRNSEMHSCPYRFYFSDFGRLIYFGRTTPLSWI